MATHAVVDHPTHAGASKSQRVHTVLVTGISGRIGTAVARELLKSNFTIHGYDVAPCPVDLSSKIIFHRGKLENEMLIREALKGCHSVVHLAACPDDAVDFDILNTSNIIGTAVLLREIERVNATSEFKISRLVIASSGKLFAGHSGKYPITLDTRTSPVCAYGATKAFVEASCQSFSRDPTSGCTTICLRFAWCPRTSNDMQAMRDCLDDASLPDEFLSPHDAATCVRAALLVPAEHPDLVRDRCSILFCQSLPSSNRIARFDVGPTLSLLDWSPERSFPDGMDELVAQRDPEMDRNYNLRRRDDLSPGMFLRPSSFTVGTANDTGDDTVKAGRDRVQDRVQDRVTHKEWVLRVQVAAAYQIFAMHGWTHAIHTHITAKVPTENEEDEFFLINPYGYHWDEITASSLIKVKADGGIVDHGSTTLPINPAGFKIHSAIHTSKRGKFGGDIMWTMHTHTMETVVISNLQHGLLPGLSQFAMDLGPVGIHEFEHATTPGSDVCARLVRDLGAPPCKTLLLRNHGCLTVGATAGECYFRLLQLIRACEVQVACEPVVLGEEERVVQVPEEMVQKTFAITENSYTGEPFGELEWRAAVRKLERERGVGYKE